MVNIKGFHGTLDAKADKIIKYGFIPSSKTFEWLGSGVYFFANQKDADKWAWMETHKKQNYGAQPAVLSADIVAEDKSFCDLDFRINMDRMIAETEKIIKQINGKIKADLSDAQMRCACCNFFARKNGIKVYAYTFPSVTSNEIGFPYTRKQRQLCVRDSSCIINLYKCHKGGI